MLMKRRSILLLIARSQAPGRRMQSSAGYPNRARSDGGRKLGNSIAGGVARSNGSEPQIWKADRRAVFVTGVAGGAGVIRKTHALGLAGSRATRRGAMTPS